MVVNGIENMNVHHRGQVIVTYLVASIRATYRGRCEPRYVDVGRV